MVMDCRILGTQRELDPDEWKPIANAIKASALDKGFKADAGLIANSSLVLRPIGTHNPKNGKEVKLLIDADPVDPEELVVGYIITCFPQGHSGTTNI